MTTPSIPWFAGATFGSRPTFGIGEETGLEQASKEKTEPIPIIIILIAFIKRMLYQVILYRTASLHDILGKTVNAILI